MFFGVLRAYYFKDINVCTVIRKKNFKTRLRLKEGYFSGDKLKKYEKVVEISY